MNVFKRLGTVFVFGVLFLCSCSFPAPDRFSDLLSDNDIIVRLGVCYDDVEKGRDTWYTRGELQTVIADLNPAYDIGDADVDRATRLLQEAAGRLIEYMDGSEKSPERFDHVETRFKTAVEVANEVRDA